jgi:hypothetical protein
MTLILSEECQRLLKELSEQLHIPQHLLVRIALEEFKNHYKGEINDKGSVCQTPAENPETGL